MLVWQLAMEKVKMTAGSSENSLSLTYPAHVARDSLSFLSRVSFDSIIAHGLGMVSWSFWCSSIKLNRDVPQELKIFEIANTLLDVINCVPSLTFGQTKLMVQGPRDVFYGLSSLLASLSGGQSKSLALLQGKMAAAKVPVQQVPRLIEFEDDLARSPVAVELANSPTKLLHELDTEHSRQTPTFVPFGSMKNDPDHSTTSIWTAGTALPQSHQPGLAEHAGHATPDAAQFREYELPWGLFMTQV